MSKGYFENLRPSERRLVVIVGVVFFIVINFWFVIPKFGEWDRVHARRWVAEQQLDAYQKEIAQMAAYDKIVKKMASEGQSVPPEEQSIQFSRTIQTHQAQSGVNVTSTSKMQTRTNQFFIEQSQTVVLQARENQLVNFLHSLGSGNSLIRVRDLSLRPDPSRQQLTANVKLAASYQKKPDPKGKTGTAARRTQTARADLTSSPTSTAK